MRDIIPSAYAIELDIHAEAPEVRRLAEAIREACIPHVARSTDPYDLDWIEDYDRSLAPLAAQMERLGKKVWLELIVRRAATPAGEFDIPTAVLSLRDIEPSEPRTAIGRFQAAARHPMPDSEHFVHWDNIELAHILGYMHALETSTCERGIHAFLCDFPVLLVQPFTSGAGRWVYPHEWLARHHEIDFLIATRDSMGVEWTAVELEPHNVSPFTKDRRPGARLNRAMDQIREWRVWLQSNLDFARRAEADKGLGLADITPRCHGVVLMGREHMFPESRNDWRRSLRDSDGIAVHSYDWIAREARKRLEALNRVPPGMEHLLGGIG